MISIYWGRLGDGMKLQGLKAYPKSLRLRCPMCGRFVCTGLRYCVHCDAPGRSC